MSHVGRGYDINQTFIIEPLLVTGDTPVVSACTAVYTNAISSCSGNTQIFLGDGLITFDGNLYTNDNLSANTINASTYLSGGTNLFDIISLNNITGGTFNNSTDTLTLFKQDNTTVNVTGFTDYYTTGATLIGNTVYFDRNDELSAYTLSLSAFSTVDIYVTGVTFNNNLLAITRNDDVVLSTLINNFTGLTVNGLLTANSISATTISATTFYGDGSNLTGISTQDTFVTGATYNNNTFTFRNNTGGTFTTSFNTVTGLTINGNIVVSGSSSLNGQISSANLSGSTDRLVQVNSGGTFSATQQIISAYIPSGSTAATLLENDSNWDINGFYIGTAITGTFQGQKHYDINYFYEAIQDNVFIRLIRG
jgi:hypothetical protein